MNKRGQAALEYLMTYGWALIVIAIVVGVLVFIVSSPAGDVVCSSSDPNKVNVKASQIEGTPLANPADFGTIVLTNLTGGDMKSVTVDSVTGAFLGNDLASLDLETEYTSGVEIKVLPDELDVVGGTYSTSTITLGYVDYAGLPRDVTITCSGPITTVTG